MAASIPTSPITEYSPIDGEEIRETLASLAAVAA